MKKFFAKAWLIALTVLVIGAGAVLLFAAMNASQLAQTSQTVYAASETGAELPGDSAQPSAAPSAQASWKTAPGITTGQYTDAPSAAAVPQPSAAIAPVPSAGAYSAETSQAPSDAGSVTGKEATAAASAAPAPSAAAKAPSDSSKEEKPAASAEAQGAPQAKYIIREANGSDVPGAKDITFTQAGLSAGKMLTTVFGSDFDPGKTLYVQYQKSGTPNNTYSVLVGSANYDKASFSCVIDSVSGKVYDVYRLAQRTKEEGLDDVDDQMMKDRENDPKIRQIATDLVKKYFADGRSVTEAMIDGIQWDFGNPQDHVQIDCKIHMEKGECYLVRIGYPTYRITEVSFYPLGWQSCLWGDWNSADPEHHA